ncbi:MAG TPA: hypothetical protein VFI15_05225 [Candidatus Limnocylindrales bacterium]|nr:hypothetical protein [Candidatus Limnocylindrales bacterium]
MGSVAEGAEASRPLDALAVWFDRLPAIAVGIALVALALVAYWLPGSDRWYNHFVWQAMAFLHGTAVIDWPVNGGGFPSGNDWMQDVYPLRELTGDPSTTGALLPFPPLPAIVLMPFVAIWGLATDIRAVSVVMGAIDVGLAWWALGRLEVSRTIRLATTVFFAFGTVFWYAAQLGTTWFFAHVVAIAFILGAVGVALGSDPEADDELEEGPTPSTVARDLAATLRRGIHLIDRRQFLAGVLFGIACMARLTVVFGAPFFMLVGGMSWARRSISAGIGAAIPLALLLGYNVATTGHLFHPGYEYQYRLEANGYQALGYNPDWDIEDARYLPQNLGILLFSTPAILPDHPSEFNTFADPNQDLCTGPDAARGLFDEQCPLAAPNQIGMSIFLTSPAFLLGAFAFRRRSRLVAGSFFAVGFIAFVNLMHFSQGWVQFGYRFSNDFIVFALPLVALGMQRRGRVGWLGVGLIAASVVINLWGVIWGNILGW